MRKGVFAFAAPSLYFSRMANDPSDPEKEEQLFEEAAEPVKTKTPGLPALTTASLHEAARTFVQAESQKWEAKLFGVTDGKAVGTWIEHRFTAYLAERFSFLKGNSASGIDLPGLGVDIKVTSIQQPQSSCPYKSARQKIYGLGYSLLVFVYAKQDDQQRQLGNLDFRHVIYVEAACTGDFQMTSGLRQILANEGNAEDIVAFLQDKNLPVDDIERAAIAEQVLAKPPALGYLTISNALQWRLQYTRVITRAGEVEGVSRVV